VLGEIAGRAQQLSSAERHYLAAIDLAGRAGATFVQMVSSVGLASVRGRRGDAAAELRADADRLQNGTSADAIEMRALVELARSAIDVVLARLSS